MELDGLIDGDTELDGLIDSDTDADGLTDDAGAKYVVCPNSPLPAVPRCHPPPGGLFGSDGDADADGLAEADGLYDDDAELDGLIDGD